MKVIFLIDMQSFYASVEKARFPEHANKPLVVSGDPARRSGVILAACPLAKSYGIQNAERLWEAKQKCNDLLIVRPRMQEYVDISLQITELLKQYTDLVEPFSIDEQFLDVTGSQRLFGPPEQIAKQIQQQIWNQMQVRARIGIGENKVLAKMACDLFAKHNKDGIYWLKQKNLAETLWPLPIEKLYGVGSKRTKHFRNMGIRTIGQFAKTPLERFKKKWGIPGHVLWMTAHGIDYSPVTTESHDRQKAIGHGMTLPRDYDNKTDIKVVLLELCEEVCRRARSRGVLGETVSLSVSGASYNIPQGFHRQLKMEQATNLTLELFHAACQLLERFWHEYPIRRLAVSLSTLSSDQEIQLNLFEQNRDQLLKLESTMDTINSRFGKTTLMRATSLLSASQAKDRAAKIGGHYR
ncbi:DNA polymerase IV [Alkalihalobacillus alcalophilus ATCC 27647 = CGMCC 1.3604]|uniref:DNA polymerase IV n=1 Tax=Alkalihalobacillus alcalophilus ATCC 27647 = CGMCC 1.3604 TaxID=1218173 RepID=A0A094WI54_ALKAL|nr:DNA polymerase IV [Alkalihalobacillus alcalophilus]KGA95583.1 DNA polymerase IV [Alkalihalobacillus alcalophilus ATCC 27647 = CGMCC 1.3604]MED1562925.1 DNA polymerase IV [Alkalihalobacillus alcalophilus]THG89657.1 DNA polymerase IV [Alkalihalobacillus alcalophilus ATCC 27647 = CGMCC 1.3604]